MACRGVFFALSPSQRERLLALNTDRERLEYVQEEIEAAWDEAHLLETDKAWDAIHRCLGDGTLSVSRSENLLSKLLLGGTQLCSDSQTYIINLVEHSELAEILTALKSVSKESMHARYEKLRNTYYPPELISEQDWEYTWDWFSAIPDFIAQADREGRSVIFTVDQ